MSSEKTSRHKDQMIPSSDRFIVLKKTKTISFEPLNTILYFKSNDKYAEVIYADEKSEIVFENLTQLETRLATDRTSPGQFFRIHRQYLVALYQCKEWRYPNELILRNGERLPVSKTRAKELKSRLFTPHTKIHPTKNQL